MRNPFRTPTQALLADVACWTLLVGLLVCVGVTANNALWTGVMLTVAALLGTFAVLYNGRNVRTVVRSKLANRRYRKEEEARRLAREEEEARRLRDDAAYGRQVRDLRDRLELLDQQYGR